MSMSRNDQLTPFNSSQSAPVIHNDYSLNLTVNIGPTTSLEDKDQTVTKTFDLINQQIKELRDEKDRKKKRRSSMRKSRRSSSYAFSQEVDAVPPTPESESSKETSGEKTDPVPSKTSVESKRKSTRSSEYQNLSTIQEATETPAPTRKRRFRLVPSKHVKAVPEEDLPKPRFAADRKRRDYVVLGDLTSIELIEEEE